jgi:excisionase family DNA binding protein
MTTTATTGRIRLKEAAAKLGVHPETLRRWAQEGMVTYWAVGRGRYMEFEPRDIEALDTSFRRDRAAPPVQHVTYMGIDLAGGVDMTVVVPTDMLDVATEAAAKHGVPLKPRVP